MTIRERINAAWKTKARKMDWLALETLMVDILRTDLPDDYKAALTKEAIDAYTRRGHFDVKDYIESPIKS